VRVASSSLFIPLSHAALPLDPAPSKHILRPTQSLRQLQPLWSLDGKLNSRDFKAIPVRGLSGSHARMYTPRQGSLSWTRKQHPEHPGLSRIIQACCRMMMRLHAKLRWSAVLRDRRCKVPLARPSAGDSATPAPQTPNPCSPEPLFPRTPVPPNPCSPEPLVPRTPVPPKPFAYGPLVCRCLLPRSNSAAGLAD
jgi:hypothetical protein